MPAEAQTELLPVMVEGFEGTSFTVTDKEVEDPFPHVLKGVHTNVPDVFQTTVTEPVFADTIIVADEVGLTLQL
jgi:hypothetical protein